MTRRAIMALCAAAAVGCGVSKDLYAAKQLEASEAQRKLKDETDKTAALEKKVEDLSAQLAQSKASLTQVSEEKGKLEAKSSQYEQLAQSLQGQIQAGQIELSELKGKMTVKLKDKILFSSGSARIGADGKVALDAVGQAFKDLKGKNVVVSGYTDDVPFGKGGGYQDNWDLSTARAAAVVRYLASRGVDPRLLGVAGYSEYRPLVPNDSPEGRSQNRRIEVSLTAADYTPPEVDVAKGEAGKAEAPQAETPAGAAPAKK